MQNYWFVPRPVNPPPVPHPLKGGGEMGGDVTGLYLHKGGGKWQFLALSNEEGKHLKTGM